MLSALHSEEWFSHSYPYSPFLNMESEIAELRTLTKVTKLRQQIECKQEGAWMVVRDIPDEKSRSGTRKVTSYGRSSKSITRSFSQNVSGNTSLYDTINPSNVIIEYPPENVEEKEEETPNNSIQITEVIDEPSPVITSPDIANPEKPVPVKKTSVVTLGKGNLVLIDDEDSNFQVTGISKGRVADAVSTLERVAHGEKKVKKVGFCKTEVHFAPDSGRVKIVETDEKPPPTQMLRRRKKSKSRNANKSDLPKLYFGNSSFEEPKAPIPLTGDYKNVFTTIKEPSPLRSLSAAAEIEKTKDEKNDNYGYVKKVSTQNVTNITKSDDKNSSLSYLGNVSPRLSKLLQNSMQHEFQVKQKQIMKNREVNEETQQMNFKVVDCDNEASKPVKIVTQVCLGAGGGEIEHKVVVNSGKKKESEPIYINKDVTVELRNESNKKPVTVIKDKAPKPKPRTTVIISPQVKDVKNAKLIKQPEKPLKRGSTPRPPKEISKKDVINHPKTTPKISSRSSPVKTERKSTTKCDSIGTTTNSKLQKLIKNGGQTQEKQVVERIRKTREPLRSFEKVSNGWVGHCITPIKSSSSDVRPKETQVTVTNKTVASKTTASHSYQSQGTKRSTISTTSNTKSVPRSRNEEKNNSKSSLTENKQFSLSKEHLRSAKLVKELSHKSKQEEIIASKRIVSSVNSTISSTIKRPDTPQQQSLTSRVPPRVGIVRPRIIQHSATTNKTNNVTVRIGLRRSEQTISPRQRRDSEQSDDSVVRADEEVRAYMFNTRHK